MALLWREVLGVPPPGGGNAMAIQQLWAEHLRIVSALDALEKSLSSAAEKTTETIGGEKAKSESEGGAEKKEQG